MLFRGFSTFGAMSLGLALALACGSGPQGAAPVPSPAILVKVQSVAPSSLEQQVSASGTIVSTNSVVLMPEIAGVVVDAPFEDGQAVKKGDRILKLRDDAAKAALKDADARLKLAQAKYDRIVQLFDRGNTSAQERDQAIAERDLASAAVDLARENLRRTEIRAPFSGRLGVRQVAAGASVNSTTAVTQLEDLSHLSVEFVVAERELARLSVGNPLSVTVDADPSKSFTGTLTFVSPRVDDSSRTALARATLDNSEGLLRPGMSAVIRVTARSEPNALMIPSQAVITTGEGMNVFVVGAGDTAEGRPVKLGLRQSEKVEVTDGLQPGDRLIVEGLLRLQPGAAVSIAGEIAG